jgi:hypothetical protein
MFIREELLDLHNHSSGNDTGPHDFYPISDDDHPKTPNYFANSHHHSGAFKQFADT